MVTVFCIAVIIVCALHVGFTFEDVDNGTAPSFFAITDLLLIVFALVVLSFR